MKGSPTRWRSADPGGDAVDAVLAGRVFKDGDLTRADELEVVLRCTARGWSARRIGDALGLSDRAIVRRRRWAGVSQPAGGVSLAYLASDNVGRRKYVHVARPVIK